MVDFRLSSAYAGRKPSLLWQHRSTAGVKVSCKRGYAKMQIHHFSRTVIALLVLGPKKLPGLGKGIGESIRGFKSAMAAKEEEPAPTNDTIGERK